MNKTVYLSGVIENVPTSVRQFKEAEEFYKDQGYIVFNPMEEKSEEECLVGLRECSHIVLIGNWFKSDRCKRELKEAKDLGFSIIHYSNLNY